MTNRINNQKKNQKKIRFSWSIVLNHSRTGRRRSGDGSFSSIPLLSPLLFELNVEEEEEEGRADALFSLIFSGCCYWRGVFLSLLFFSPVLLPDELPAAFSSSSISSTTKSRQLERERKTPAAAAGPRLIVRHAILLILGNGVVVLVFNLFFRFRFLFKLKRTDGRASKHVRFDPKTNKKANTIWGRDLLSSPPLNSSPFVDL